MGSTLSQLREGIDFIRGHRSIGWSLTYLALAASLVGVLGVLGPDFATDSLGLEPKDFVVVVLPLGFGIVTGILLLNSFGHVLPRRRIIEGGLDPARDHARAAVDRGPDRPVPAARRDRDRDHRRSPTSRRCSRSSCFIALLAGMAYAAVAIPAQTQLQEDLPGGRPRARVRRAQHAGVDRELPADHHRRARSRDLVGTTTVLVVVGVVVTLAGVLSIVRRGPIRPTEPHVDGSGPSQPLDPMARRRGGGRGPRRAAVRAERPPTTPPADDAAAEPAGRGMTARADLVLVGRIATLAGSDGPAWAEAIAVRAGRVVAAGAARRRRGPGGPGHAPARARRRRGRDPRADRRAPAPGRRGDRAVAGRARGLRLDRGAGGRVRRGGRGRGERGPPTPGSRAAAGIPTRSAGGRRPPTSRRAAPGRRVALWAHDHHALVASPRGARGGGRRRRSVATRRAA